MLRYYYRPLLDAAEQGAGPDARRGLFYQDARTGRPVLKDSGRFYGEIIRRRGVTPEMYEEFVAGQEYRH